MSRYPKKLFYKIGEVCDICGVEPHVLRYWESEFAVLGPTRNRSGQRIYRQRDLDTVETIKRLLYQEGYTIAGAIKQLEHMSASPEEFPLFNRKSRKTSPGQILSEIKQDLQSVLDVLDGVDPAAARPKIEETVVGTTVEKEEPVAKKTQAPAADASPVAAPATSPAKKEVIQLPLLLPDLFR